MREITVDDLRFVGSPWENYKKLLSCDSLKSMDKSREYTLLEILNMRRFTDFEKIWIARDFLSCNIRGLFYVWCERRMPCTKNDLFILDLDEKYHSGNMSVEEFRSGITEWKGIADEKDNIGFFTPDRTTEDPKEMKAQIKYLKSLLKEG